MGYKPFQNDTSQSKIKKNEKKTNKVLPLEEKKKQK